MPSPSIARVIEAATAAGISLDIVEFPDGTRTAADAAAAVGCSVDQIVKSMVFASETGLVLALTSGLHRVDTDRLAAALGLQSCGRADADQVRASTGFAIGGVAPFGHLSPVTAVMDPHLFEFDQVWAAAGTPRHVFAIEPAELRTVAGATVVEFTTSG